MPGRAPSPVPAGRKPPPAACTRPARPQPVDRNSPERADWTPRFGTVGRDVASRREVVAGQGLFGFRPPGAPLRSARGWYPLAGRADRPPACVGSNGPSLPLPRDHPARNRLPCVLASPACIPERWPTRSRRWAPWSRVRDRSRFPALHDGPCRALRDPGGGALTNGPANPTRWSGRGLATIFLPTPCPIGRPATGCHACPRRQGVRVAPALCSAGRVMTVPSTQGGTPLETSVFLLEIRLIISKFQLGCEGIATIRQ
jgi:hypothetical protein